MSRTKQWLIAILVTALSFGVLIIMAKAEDAPPADYQLMVTPTELIIVSDALMELPFKRSAPLIAKLRAQVDAQEAARKRAAEKPEVHQ
jgi:hypothetical protein